MLRARVAERSARPGGTVSFIDAPRRLEARLAPLRDFPILVLLVSVFVLWLTVLLGRALAARVRATGDGDRDDLALITGASLTLLALIIGFTFSMALGRFDQRRNYEEEEANAIGTEYLRVDLLPAADAQHIRELLKQYLDQRLLFYRTLNADRLDSIASETARLQNEMWTIVQVDANLKPSPLMALVVSGMNDVLNRAGYTVAAWRYRVPAGAWLTMIVLSIGCCVLIGFGAQRRRPLLSVFPFLIAVSFFFIADIDSPRRGIIHVPPQNLISLSQSLRSR